MSLSQSLPLVFYAFIQNSRRLGSLIDVQVLDHTGHCAVNVSSNFRLLTNSSTERIKVS